MIQFVHPGMVFSQDGKSVTIEDALNAAEGIQEIELKPPKMLDPTLMLPPEDHIILNILEVQDMKINEVLDLIATRADIEIKAPRDLGSRVTIFLQEVNVRDALRIILDTNNLAYFENDGVFNVVTAEEFERMFNFTFGQKIQTRIIPLIHTDGNDILEIVEQMKGLGGRVVYNPDSNSFLITEEPEKLVVMEAFIKARDVQTKEKIIQLKFIRPEDILLEIRAVLTEGVGKVEADNIRKILKVTDTALKIQEIEKLVKMLDEKDHEVYIKIQVIQIILNDEHLKGVDWEAIVSGYKSVVFKGFRGKDGDERERVLHLGTVSEEDFTILLDALDTVGIINTTANYRIMIMEDEETPINISYMEDTSVNYVIKQFEQSEKVTYYLRPKVFLDGEINLRIRPEFEFLDKYEFGRKMTSAENISVADGGTIVIGGLFKDIKVESLWKIPLLGDLPILGFAFRNQYKQIRKTEVITFFIPRVEEIQ